MYCNEARQPFIVMCRDVTEKSYRYFVVVGNVILKRQNLLIRALMLLIKVSMQILFHLLIIDINVVKFGL
jgi:hypothetical protein